MEEERGGWGDREADALFKAVADNANYGIGITDRCGNLVYVNEYFARAHGYEVAELEGEKISVFHNDAQLPLVMELTEAMCEGQDISAVEVGHARRDGGVFPMLMNLVPLGGSVGRPQYIATTAVDITERKQWEEELHRQRERLEELVQERTLGIMLANERLREEIANRIRVGEELEERNRELDAFAHTVAHDLRGSLSLVSGFAVTAQAAAGKGEHEVLRECLGSIEEVAHRMEDFVASILAYARAQGPVGEAERVDSDAILRQVVEENAEDIAQLGIEVEVLSDLPALKADPPRVYQVLSNLVGNAVKHMGDCPRPRIEVSCRECGDMAVFRVSDTGAGIPEEEQEGIFAPFRRCSGPEYPGLGIGLSTVKCVVEGWGGKVWLESVPGEGASFYFSAPSCGEGG